MTSSNDGAGDRPRPAGSLIRFLPVALIACGAAAVFATGAHRYLSLAAISENYAALKSFVAANAVRAAAAYALAYVAVAALSLPGATLMSLLGGLLFGNIVGTTLVVVSATIGATILFLAARTAFAETFRARASGFIQRMEAGFNGNAFSYLLLLRLIPIFPFFIVNVAPAFSRISVPAYVLATFIGIIPGAFAYVSAGNGLGAALERGGDIQLRGLLLQPEILTPIIALSVLAILPIAYRAIRKRRAGPA